MRCGLLKGDSGNNTAGCVRDIGKGQREGSPWDGAPWLSGAAPGGHALSGVRAKGTILGRLMG